VRVSFTRTSPHARAPAQAHPGDAGYDLYAAETKSLDPGERQAVDTGIQMAIPEGYCGLVLPRSGLASHYGISVVNAPGLIDSGFRGEVRVLLLNTDRRSRFDIAPGDRIAQLLIVEAMPAEFVETAHLEESTVRGSAGFGSSGV
jgi:dUTP pyrophosphatase